MLRVVVIAPIFDRELRLGHRHKPMCVEALVTQPAVEALDECVLCRLPWLNEGQRDASPVGPCIEDPSRKLRSVVDDDRRREWTRAAQLREDLDHASAV